MAKKMHRVEAWCPIKDKWYIVCQVHNWTDARAEIREQRKFGTKTRYTEVEWKHP